MWREMRVLGGKVDSTDIRAVLQATLLLWESPLFSAVLAFLAYLLVSLQFGPVGHASRFAYYNYLADAFLHGQLSLHLLPAQVHDLVLYHGNYYLYWPPFPAVLLAPFVAVFGVGFSDVLFTLALGSLDVGLVALLLRQADRRGIISLSSLQRALLVLFFALGTVMLTLAPYGRVWYTGQLVAFLCIALAYLAAISLRGWIAFLLTGLALALAMLTRNHLVFAGVWPAWFLLKSHAGSGWKRQIALGLAGVGPIVIAVGMFAAYNWLRFGGIFNVGLDYHLMDPSFISDYRRFGAFNLHYLATNLHYQYIFYPFPLSKQSYMGGSLFLLSPVFFAGITAIFTDRRRISNLVLLASILLVDIPILLLMGTGWVQFGPRYSLDFIVPLLILTARGVKNWPDWLFGILTLISVASYWIGTFFLMGSM